MLNSLFSCFDNIIVLDIETTGFNYKTDEIIEIAALRIACDSESHRIECEFNALIQLSEGRSLPLEIVNLTGITEQMLQQSGKPKVEAYKQLAEILNKPKTLLVAYNAQFDLCFLCYFFMKHKNTEVLKRIKMLDAMTVYKDRRDYPHKLSDAINAYKLKCGNTHRAIDDTKAMLELLVAMGKERDDLDRYVNLFGYNPKYGISGTKISSVKYLPQGYNRRERLYEVQ